MIRRAAGAASPASATTGAPWQASASLFFARLCLAVAAVLFLVEGRLFALEKKPGQTVEGLIVAVPPTITTESTHRLRSLLHGPLERFKAGASRQGGRFTVLCNFNPENKTAECDDFGAALSLARYLRSLQTGIRGVGVVAYVHGDVRRHSVLPVLACSEIVFSARGRLGQVTAADRPLSKTDQTGYEEITRGRYPAVLVRKMYDAAAEVLRDGGQFVDGDSKPRPRGQPVAELAGQGIALYDFALARKVGLCQQVARASLDDVRKAYDLDRSTVVRALDRTTAWRIPVEGPITGKLVEETRDRIRRALREGANVLLIELLCGGGELDRAHELGRYLAEINEQRAGGPPVETVAFVTARARNLAVLPALGCQRIVMQKEAPEGPDGADEDEVQPREARLGGLGPYIDRHPDIAAIRKEIQLRPPPARLADLERNLAKRRQGLEEELRNALTDLAERQRYSVTLIEGLCSRDLRIVAVERVGGTGREFVPQAEYEADQKGPGQYRKVMQIKPWKDEKNENRYLTLSADQAVEVGLAQAVVKDFNGLCALEGVTASEVRTPETGWLYALAGFLRAPWTSVVLVMLGITCLILELKMPGVGLPGVIAAICFVLFFWAHSQLHGQITWLALLLFVLGLALIGLEVFVLPGFGVCGISGIILVLVSLGLVAYGHWPRTTEEWVGFGHKLSPFGISMLGSLVGVFLIVRYLPHIPVLNRLLLRTADEHEYGVPEPDNPLHAEYQALLGAIGVAATPLRPAGKTQFGDAFVDVVAEGGYVLPGTRVQVIEIEGNRVVVKEV